MTDENCQHEWKRGRLTDGRPIDSCTKCPRWKLSILAFTSRDPERRRRSMEETSRHLGEHRDV